MDVLWFHFDAAHHDVFGENPVRLNNDQCSVASPMFTASLNELLLSKSLLKPAGRGSSRMRTVLNRG